MFMCYSKEKTLQIEIKYCVVVLNPMATFEELERRIFTECF